MTLGSLFDGIGGFPLCAERAGITPLWASEIDPQCVGVTKRHFPGMRHLGSVTEINGDEIPPVDVITFGSPCQDLSIAGKRAGLSGERSGLFSEAVRIIREMREATNGRYPAIAVWENVPGAFSSNKGEDFRQVLQQLAGAAGCDTVIPRPVCGWRTAGIVVGDGWSIAWRVLDAQFWGVPQRRRRIYLVTDFRGGRAAEILFERKSLRGDTTPGETARKGAAANFRCGAPGTDRYAAGFNGWRSVSGSIEYNVDCAPTIQATAPPQGIIAFSAGQGVKAGGIGLAEGCAPTLRASASGTNQVPAVCYPDISPTLTTRSGNISPSPLPLQSYTATTPCICHGDGITSATLTGDHQSRVTDYTTICIQGNVVNRDAGQNGSGVCEGVSNTLNAVDRHAVCCMATGQANAEITAGIAPTLNCNHEQPIIADRWIVRRFTPTECERLQGFPDGWTAWVYGGRTLKDTPRYRMLGNSLAIPTAYHVISRVKKTVK